MLYVYLDESGIGDIQNEKHVIVAGVIVQAEQQDAVQKRIEEVRDKYVPEKYRKDFVFHAADLFQGSKKVMSREAFPTAQRRDALEELIAIASELKLPIVQAWHSREDVGRAFPDLDAKGAVVRAQAIAATSCMLTVEAFTQRYALDSTQALITYENNDQAKSLVNVMHNDMQKPDTLRRLDPRDAEKMKKLIPLKRVLEATRFAEKGEAPILQLADVCAYFIRRRMTGRMDSMRFLGHIMNQLTSNAESLWPLGTADAPL